MRGMRRSRKNVSLSFAALASLIVCVCGSCSKREASQPAPAAAPPSAPAPAPAPPVVRDAAADVVVDAATDAGDARGHGARKSLAPAGAGGGGNTGVKVEGSLPRGEGEKVVRAAQPKLRACAGSGGKGRVSFKMTVDDRGHVTVAEIPHSTLPGGSDVETCMVHVLRDLRFPRATGESSISFQMSFGR